MSQVNLPHKITMLSGLMRSYLREIIGLDCVLYDHKRPHAIDATKDAPPQIGLPLRVGSAEDFFGKSFIFYSSPQLLFSVTVALLYHEVAHVISGEDHTFKPYAIANMINDANDYTFVPDTWPGSIPFTQLLMDAVYSKPQNIPLSEDLSYETNLNYAIAGAMQYLRKLRIFHQDTWVRKLPDNHAMASVFTQVQRLMREARRVRVNERRPLMEQLHHVLRAFFVQFVDERGERRNIQRAKKKSIDKVFDDLVSAAGEQMVQGTGILALNLSPDTVKKMNAQLRQSAHFDHIQELIERLDDTGGEGRGEGHSHTASPRGIVKVQALGMPVRVDAGLAASVRRVLRPKLFKRTLARRGSSVVGVRFAPERFWEVKVNPKKPRIRQDIMRIGRLLDEAGVFIVFDRSGSMEGGKSGLAKMMMATLYEALALIPKVQVALYSFDSQIYEIANWRAVDMSRIFRAISTGMGAQGGTNLPWALHQAVGQMRAMTVHKKIIIGLTDGDTKGSMPIEEVVKEADECEIELIVLGIGEADKSALSVFGKNGLYVRRLNDLPGVLARVVVEHV